MEYLIHYVKFKMWPTQILTVFQIHLYIEN